MNIVDAIIEIPMNTKNKFEVDKNNGRIRLDRVLYTTMSYPAEYGFIENTLELDGDPLDILVMSSVATFPGCVVPARVIGNLKILDDGVLDNKIISVNNVDPRYDEINSLSDLSKFTLDEIKNFFENYKTLQKISVEVVEYQGKDEALNIIHECKERFENK